MDDATQRTHWQGWYYDGRTARREPVGVLIGPAGIGLVSEDGRVSFWPYEELRQTQGAFAHEPVRLERGDDAPEALVVDDRAFLQAMAAAAPHLRRRLRTAGSATRNRRLAAGVFAILAAALALYLWGVPALAARLSHRVPEPWVERLGEEAVRGLIAGARQCPDPALQQTIERMGAVLAQHAGRPADAFQFLVVDDSLVNALALPGGHIIFFRGLIERAGTPDELAGVLAHEMQHVMLRHSTQALLRELPVRLLIAGLTGDAPALGQALHAAATLRSLHFSREAEREADREAVALLSKAGADPRGLLAFLGRLEADDEDGLPAYFSTHPPTGERIRELERLAAAAPARASAWALAGEWAQIRASCQ